MWYRNTSSNNNNNNNSLNAATNSSNHRGALLPGLSSSGGGGRTPHAVPPSATSPYYFRWMPSSATASMMPSYSFTTNPFSMSTTMLLMLVSMSSFLLGTSVSLFWLGHHGTSTSAACRFFAGEPQAMPHAPPHGLDAVLFEAMVQQRLQQEKIKWQQQETRKMRGGGGGGESEGDEEDEDAADTDCPPAVAYASNSTTTSSSSLSSSFLPPDRVGKFAVDLRRVSRESLRPYMGGVPVDVSKDGMQDALLLYSKAAALPSTTDDDPLQHCDYLNVLLTDASGKRNQCVAIIPQYESFHLFRYMRMNTVANKLDPSQPLQFVGRGQVNNGRNAFKPPQLNDTQQHWSLLQQYMDHLPDVLQELNVTLKRIADEYNTVIVMVCNFGQAELLMNFVCTARSRGFDLSNVIVFTTDVETTELATALNLTAYYDHRNFGDIPTGAARRYGDARFVAMMMAKVICVQLVSLLGYNFLFQDVDIVWFQHPLTYFRDDTLASPAVDVFFQDDGGHTVRYAPYSANSGFYFVRYNDRTRHFLTSLLMAGDLVLRTDSHQQALIAVMTEHSSLFGLRVKVLSRDTPEFPGGYHFHQKSKEYMKAFYAKKVHPYIFHMSWTLNKDNKLKFLQQMGQWYVQKQCVGKKLAEIPQQPKSASATSLLFSTCCAAEPLFQCHYRDKPSLLPCKESPPIDKGKKSFW